MHHSGIAPLVALAFVDATLAFVARTITRSAAATTLIPHDLMPEGKAAFNVALAIAMIGGPAVAGLAVSLLGASTALAIDAGSFLLAAALIAPVAIPAHVARSTTDGEAAAPARGRLREGLRYIAAHRSLRVLIVGEGAAFVFFYLVVPVTVVYASESLHAGAGAYAALLDQLGDRDRDRLGDSGAPRTQGWPDRDPDLDRCGRGRLSRDRRRADPRRRVRRERDRGHWATAPSGRRSRPRCTSSSTRRSVHGPRPCSRRSRRSRPGPASSSAARSQRCSPLARRISSQAWGSLVLIAVAKLSGFSFGAAIEPPVPAAP